MKGLPREVVESLSLAGCGTQCGVADKVVLLHKLVSISEVFPVLNDSMKRESVAIKNEWVGVWYEEVVRGSWS